MVIASFPMPPAVLLTLKRCRALFTSCDLKCKPSILKFNNVRKPKASTGKQLWGIANLLRGKISADDYRDYILRFIFYK